MITENSKNTHSGTLLSVIVRLSVLFFALLLFIMFRTVLDTGWTMFADALGAIAWAGNLLFIKQLSKAFFNKK